MRVSTQMVFDSTVASLNDKSASMLRTQQQLSNGKRILTPADDPVAAAQVLDLSQAAAVNDQYQAAQGSAKSTLGLIDSQLSSTSDLLARIRELVLQSGNSALSASDRGAIAAELRSRHDELLGIANSADSNGQYLFSGYQGANKPFAGSVENGVEYFGDDGQRALRISNSRLMPTSLTGSDLFMNIRNGNGNFVTAPQTAGNVGSGVIDAGSVTDLAKWNGSANSGHIEVRFWMDPSTSSLYYDLVDAEDGNSLYTGTPSIGGGAGNTFTHAYSSGSAIDFDGLAAPYNDFGAQVTISGAPSSGDAFTIARSTPTDMFSMLADMIGAVEMPGAAGNAARQNALGAALINLAQVEDNVLRVRADVGSRLNELDDLGSLASGLDLQYQSRISALQDVDYNQAIVDLTRQQTELQATQQSFAKIAGMSLFNYL